MHVYHTYIYIYYLSMLPLSGIHQGHPRTHVCFSPFTTFLLGPMEASLAEMRLYWTEQKEAKNGRFGTEKRPWLTGFVFCCWFFFRDREAEALQDPRFGKVSFGSVRCANSEGEFASIYTSCEVIQVVLNKSDLLR